MTGEKYSLSLLFTCVAMGCLLTSAILKITLTSAENERDKESDTVLNGNTHGGDVFSITSIWMTCSSDRSVSTQPLFAVKSMVILGAVMSFLAIILTSLHTIVRDKSVFKLFEFIANVAITLTGIYLILCAASYIAVRLDPKGIYYVDQNSIGMLDVITLIVAIFAVVLYLHETRYRLPPREQILHL